MEVFKIDLFGFGNCVSVSHDIYITGTVIFYNRKGNEKFTIKLNKNDIDSYWKAINFVTDIKKEHGRNENFWSILGEELHKEYGVMEFEYKETKQYNSTKKAASKKVTITDNIPQIEMLATYANILFKGNIVDVVFTNDKEEHTITFKYRRSWSNRKYVDTAISKSGIKPAWDFRYGWEWVAS